MLVLGEVIPKAIAQHRATGLILRLFPPLAWSAWLLLPLTWIAILHGRIKADIALTSGVHSAEDALKGLMVGASVTMMASELILNGIQRVADIKADVIRWMEEHEYESVSQMRGSMSQKSVASPAAFERAHYMRAITMNEPVIPS